MAQAFATHQDVVNHFLAEMARRPQDFPPHFGIFTPPGPGACCHCGVPVPEGQHERGHQVAMVTDPELLMQVNHCDNCLDQHPECRDDTPGGHCVLLEG